MELLPANADKVTTAEQQEIDDRKTKDKKAKKEICLRVADEQLVYINQTMSASAMWTSLQAIFEPKDAVGVLDIDH